MTALVLASPRRHGCTQIFGRILRRGSDESIRRIIVDIVDVCTGLRGQVNDRKKAYNIKNYPITKIQYSHEQFTPGDTPAPALGDGMTLALGDGMALALGDGMALALGDGMTLALGDGMALALGDGMTLALGDGMALALGDGMTPSKAGAGDTLALGDGNVQGLDLVDVPLNSRRVGVSPFIAGAGVSPGVSPFNAGAGVSPTTDELLKMLA